MSQNGPKLSPKSFIGTDEIGFHVHFGAASMLVGPKSALTKPSAAHFELVYSQFGLHFRSIGPVREGLICECEECGIL